MQRQYRLCGHCLALSHRQHSQVWILDLRTVYSYMSSTWNKHEYEVESEVDEAFELEEPLVTLLDA